MSPQNGSERQKRILKQESNAFFIPEQKTLRGVLAILHSILSYFVPSLDWLHGNTPRQCSSLVAEALRDWDESGMASAAGSSLQFTLW